ncbi:putative transcription factor interactor and regulator CCHC(Zn) family [Helianthus annuus]|nr:putative transcription factor interactor and regulator CCHC(Zn) family [Helianthus annuus]
MKIMSGRGGRINLTQAQLTALINERVAEALAAVPAGGQPAQPPVCTFKTFMDCRPSTFSGTEGAVGLLHWFEKLESVFEMCECPEDRRVKYAIGTLEGAALTWWKAQVQLLGLAVANAIPWNGFKELIREEYCSRDDIHKLEVEFFNLKMTGSEIEAYTKRSNELAILCPTMVDPHYKRIELYLKGLVPEIQSHVTSANLGTIQQVVKLAHRLTDQAVEQNRLPKRISATTSDAPNDNKRKWDGNLGKGSVSAQSQQRKTDEYRSPSQQSSGNQSQGGYKGNHPKCNRCNLHHSGPCGKGNCHRCNKPGHMARDCRSQHPANQNRQQQQAPPNQRQQRQQQGNNKGCFQCGAEGHFKRNCPQLNQNQNNNQRNGNHNGNNNGGNNGGNNNGNGAQGRVFVIGQGEARNDPNVVMGKFLLDDFFVTVLFDSGADTSYVSVKVSQMLKRTPTLLNTKHTVELANGKSLEATHVVRSCNLVLAGQTFSIDLIPITLGSFDVVIGMDWLSHHQAEIVCKEKIVRIPSSGEEPLMIRGDKVVLSKASSLSLRPRSVCVRATLPF